MKRGIVPYSSNIDLLCCQTNPVLGSHLVMLNTECRFNITRVLEYIIAYNAVLAERYWTDVYLYISVICIKNCIQQLGFYLHRWMIECKVTTSSSAQVNPFHLCSIRFTRVKSPRRPQKKHTRDGHMWTVLICKVCATSTVHQREPSTVLYEPAPFTCYMMLGRCQIEVKYAEDVAGTWCTKIWYICTSFY